MFADKWGTEKYHVFFLTFTYEYLVWGLSRNSIIPQESIAQQIEQILELENLEEVYNSKITLHPNQMYI